MFLRLLFLHLKVLYRLFLLDLMDRRHLRHLLLKRRQVFLLLRMLLEEVKLVEYYLNHLYLHFDLNHRHQSRQLFLD